MKGTGGVYIPSKAHVRRTCRTNGERSQGGARTDLFINAFPDVMGTSKLAINLAR